MIPIFRKTRKKMADDNRPVKYMRYAFGEIVLVVIGILIALQINTWNEERKTRIIEIKTLNEIRGNLYVDLKELRSDIAVMDSVSNSGRAAIAYFEKNTNPSESFKYNVHVSGLNPHFDPNQSGYSLLISKGLEIVTNDSLRGSISRLYELDYPYYSKYENERISMLINVFHPKMTTYFSFLWSDDIFFNGTTEITQDDYSKLKMDKSFTNVMNFVITKNEMVKNRAERTVNYISSLIAQIEHELAQKNNL